MKPHIFYDPVFHEWHCRTDGCSGYGDTPDEAYTDWKALRDLYNKLYYQDLNDP